MSVSFFIKIFIEIIVESHKIVRNDTEDPLYTPPSFPHW